MYTPPDHLNLSKENGNQNIIAQDSRDPSLNTTTQVGLYRIPVVLVHGIWSNPKESWVDSRFQAKMKITVLM